MHVSLLHHSMVRRLPGPLQSYMQKRFLLTQDYLKALRCVEFEGYAGEKSVRRYTIFDGREALNRHLLIASLSDIENHPELVLFEGYIDRDGKGYAADRRVLVIIQKYHKK